jgi:hypothetical protein
MYQQENARFKVKNSFTGITSARRQTRAFEAGDTTLKLEYNVDTEGHKPRILNQASSSGKYIDQKI